jgi:putative ABC transport system permease protein
MMRHAAYLTRLAAKSLLFDLRLTLCHFLGLVAVLVPLMLVMGLKYGAIQGLVDKLNQDPRNLEISVIGNYHLDADWFAALRRAPQTAFVIPATRSLSTTINLAIDQPGGALLRGVQLIPTADGDPLLKGLGVPQQDDDIVLSESAAKALGVKTGDRVRGLVNRRLDNADEIGARMLKVVAIAPAATVNQDVAFVTLRLLVRAEDYRDGKVADLRSENIGTEALSARSYASARLYADTLEDVAPLADLAGRDNVTLRTKAQEIATVQLLDRALTLIATIIVSLGGIGAGLSIAANQWANVERQRRDISMLRLLGLQRAEVLLLPIAQSLIVACSGYLVSALLFMLASITINNMFSLTGISDSPICRLEPAHFAWFGAATLVVAGLAAIVGGAHVVKIDPSESLRAV